MRKIPIEPLHVGIALRVVRKSQSCVSIVQALRQILAFILLFLFTSNHHSLEYHSNIQIFPLHVWLVMCYSFRTHLINYYRLHYESTVQEFTDSCLESTTVRHIALALQLISNYFQQNTAAETNVTADCLPCGVI